MNGMFTFLNGKSSECNGDLGYDRGTATIDCTSCQGPADLGEPRCFKGLAGRIPPGFNGEIILRSRVERGFKGPVVEALTAYSDILSILGSMIERKKISIVDRIVTGELERVRDRFMEDPSSIVRDSERIRKKIERSGSGNGSEMARTFDDIVERASLMVRKLEHNTP